MADDTLAQAVARVEASLAERDSYLKHPDYDKEKIDEYQVVQWGDLRLILAALDAARAANQGARDDT